MYVCTWVYNLSIVQVISYLVIILIWISFESENLKIDEKLDFWGIIFLYHECGYPPNCTPQIFDIIEYVDSDM